jgi:hypothetical protein
MTTHFRRLGLLAIVATAAGCSSSYPLAPVSGVVTLDGKPLAEARVAFQPRSPAGQANAGPGSYAKTDDAGRYRLKTITGVDGAVVAVHDVSISTFQGKADPGSDGLEVVRPELVPARYALRGALTFTVEAKGSDTADFHLSTNGSAMDAETTHASMPAFAAAIPD